MLWLGIEPWSSGLQPELNPLSYTSQGSVSFLIQCLSHCSSHSVCFSLQALYSFLFLLRIFFGKFCISFPLFIELIVVTLGNKIIQVSGAQFYNTSFVHCIMHSPPKVKSLFIIIYPCIYPHMPFSTYSAPFSMAITTLLSISMSFLPLFFLFCSIPLFPQGPQPLTAVSLLPIFLSISLVSSFCSLDSTYEWNHIILILWLAYFT